MSDDEAIHNRDDMTDTITGIKDKTRAQTLSHQR